jgi:predicted amidophosphoribosyltransferase
MLWEHAETVIEKLKAETRTCPQCYLEVRHPFVERCPRCYSKLPRFVLECSGCIHHMMCPFAKESSPAAR